MIVDGIATPNSTVDRLSHCRTGPAEQRPTTGTPSCLSVTQPPLHCRGPQPVDIHTGRRHPAGEKTIPAGKTHINVDSPLRGMADVRLTGRGTYRTPDGPGSYMEWRVEDDIGGLDFQVFERGHPPEQTRGYRLEWGTDLALDTFAAVAAGDHWLGGNPDVRVYKERLREDNPVETTWTDYRWFPDATDVPASPDGWEVVNGQPPERYLVGWDRANHVDERAAHTASMTVNPRGDALLPDSDLADHVAMYLRAARGGEAREPLDALLDAFGTDTDPFPDP